MRKAARRPRRPPSTHHPERLAGFEPQPPRRARWRRRRGRQRPTAPPPVGRKRRRARPSGQAPGPKERRRRKTLQGQARTNRLGGRKASDRCDRAPAAEQAPCGKARLETRGPFDRAPSAAPALCQEAQPEGSGPSGRARPAAGEGRGRGSARNGKPSQAGDETVAQPRCARPRMQKGPRRMRGEGPIGWVVEAYLATS